MIETSTRDTPPAALPGGVRVPSRNHPRGDDSLQALFDLGWVSPTWRARGGLSRVLRAAYDGDLAVALRTDRPTVVANFVETVDGVVALDSAAQTGGGEVSGFNPADRLVMTLLRGLADAVVVGAGTVRASGGGSWTGTRLRPDLADELAVLRTDLGLAPQPTTIVVTASGRLDPGHPGFRDPAVPVVIAASASAIDGLRATPWPAQVRIEALPADLGLGTGIVEIARRVGARLVLSEAGPHVTSQLLEDRVLDELFLTVAPQLAGRSSEVSRLSLVEGRGFWPDDQHWLRLVSIRRSGDHLFLRYRLEDLDDEG